MIRAEFFDIPGFIAWVFILVVGIISLKRKLPKWVSIILILIGIMGALADGMIIIRTYFLGG